MKRFNELTREELGQMSKDDFCKIVKIELMNAGLPVEEPKINTPEIYKADPIEKDMFLLEKVGYIFKSKEDALAAKKILSRGFRVNRYGYYIEEKYRMYIEPDVEESISMVDVYNKEDLAKWGESINVSVKETTEESKRRKFVEELLEKYNEAVNFMYEAKKLAYIFIGEYLQLSDGDYEMAMGFFKKSRVVDEETENIIRNYVNKEKR